MGRITAGRRIRGRADAAGSETLGVTAVLGIGETAVGGCCHVVVEKSGDPLSSDGWIVPLRGGARGPAGPATQPRVVGRLIGDVVAHRGTDLTRMEGTDSYAGAAQPGSGRAQQPIQRRLADGVRSVERTWSVASGCRADLD